MSQGNSAYLSSFAEVNFSNATSAFGELMNDQTKNEKEMMRRMAHGLQLLSMALQGELGSIRGRIARLEALAQGRR